MRRFLDDGRFFFLNSKKWGAQIHYTLNYTFFVIFALVLYFDPHTFLFTHTHNTHRHARNTLDEGYSQCSNTTACFVRGYLCCATDDFTLLLLISPRRKAKKAFQKFRVSKKSIKKTNNNWGNLKTFSTSIKNHTRGNSRVPLSFIFSMGSLCKFSHTFCGPNKKLTFLSF